MSWLNLLFTDPTVCLLNPLSWMTMVAGKDSHGLWEEKYRGTPSMSGK